MHNLIGNWDRWVKRRVEQIELATDSVVRRRISVDFRLHDEVFGTPAVRWGDDWVHYVPLTLLEKAPFVHFDLRDEANQTLPLITRRKNANIGAATLAAAAKVLVIRHHLMRLHGRPKSTSPLNAVLQSEVERVKRPTDGTPALRVDAIQLHSDLEAIFRDLCYLPFRREISEPDERGARDVWNDLLKTGLTEAQERKVADVTDWSWTLGEDGSWSAPDISQGAWMHALLSDHTFSELAFDFSRLFMVCAPVTYEPGRRRVLKIQYDEHLSEPGLRILGTIRSRYPDFAKRVRQREDELEGLNPDHEHAYKEWIQPESTSNRRLRRPTIGMKVGRGIGWLSKPMTFELPGIGFGGTFHLEFAAPNGTQLRRARLRSIKSVAREPEEPPATVEVSKTAVGQKAAEDAPDEPDELEIVEEQFARRYARDVVRCHLYLGGLRQGAWGDAFVAIKPSTRTIIRGAALTSVVTTILILFSALEGDDLAERPSTVVALLLLAPGLVAAQVARPNEHPVTTGMVFGLRLLALSVAGVAAIAAGLLGSGHAASDSPLAWTVLAGLALVLTTILLRAWRLAGRDWPWRSEV